MGQSSVFCGRVCRSLPILHRRSGVSLAFIVSHQPSTDQEMLLGRPRHPERVCVCVVRLHGAPLGVCLCVVHIANLIPVYLIVNAAMLTFPAIRSSPFDECSYCSTSGIFCTIKRFIFPKKETVFRRSNSVPDRLDLAIKNGLTVALTEVTSVVSVLS